MSRQLYCIACNSTFPWYAVPANCDECRTLDIHDCPHCGERASHPEAAGIVPPLMVRDNDQDQHLWGAVVAELEPVVAAPLVAAPLAPLVRDNDRGDPADLCAFSCWACYPGCGTAHPREALRHQPWCAETPRIDGRKCRVCGCPFKDGACVCTAFFQARKESAWMCYHCGLVFDDMDRHTHNTETCPHKNE